MNISVNDLKDDCRFYIDDRNINRLLRDKVYKYRVIEIPVGGILRKQEVTGRIISLYDTKVYQYLKDTPEGRKAYQEYVDLCNVSFRSFDNYDKLRTEIKNCGYDIMKGAIVIDQDCLILDGQHRSCLLLKKYGPQFKVKVVQLFYNKSKYSFLRRIMLYFTQKRIMNSYNK